LYWQTIFDARILLFGDLHLSNILTNTCFINVNTP
jgi:hypothetical protein